MIGEWENSWWLETPEGTLYFNLDFDTDFSEGLRFQLVPLKCNANLPVRVTNDDIPQGDGAIPHRRWRSGFTVHLAVELLKRIPGGGDEDLEAACDEDLVYMLDLLGLHINSMIRTGLVSGYPNARLFFTPSGAGPLGDRMFDRCQLNTGGSVSLSEGSIGPQVEWDMDTAFPYYIEATETQTMLSDTGVQIITNNGNTDYFPVIKVYGPTSGFVLLNDSVTDPQGNPLVLYYNSSLPGAAAIGGGAYVEINMFGGTAFKNGNEDNLLAGIDMRYTSFWPLVPGDNLVASIDATALVLSNGAWA